MARNTMAPAGSQPRTTGSDEGWFLAALRGTILAVIAAIFSRAANIIFFFLLTWYGGEQEASTYTLGFTYTTFLLFFSLGGLEELLNREVARDTTQADRVFGSFLLARSITSLLLFGALVAWIGGPSGYSPQVGRVVLITGAILLPNSLSILCESYLIARHRVGAITLVGAITGAIKLAAGMVLISRSGGAETASWIVLVTNIVMLAIYMWFIVTRFGWPVISFDRAFWLAHARAGLPIFLISIVFTVETNLDVLMLSQRGIIEVGVYGAAANLLFPLMLIPQTYRQIILPILSEWYIRLRERAYEIYVQSERLLLILSLAVCIPLVGVADCLVPLVYQDRFHDTIPVFQVVLWTLVFYSLQVPNGRLMLAADQQFASVKFETVTMVGNILFNLVLQPTHGALGAAIARTAAMALTFLLNLLYVQRFIHHWNMWTILSAPAAGLCCWLALMGVRLVGGHWIIAAAVSLLVYVAALYGLRAVTLAEVQHVVSLVRLRLSGKTA